MLLIIKPILFTFIKSDSVKKLVIDLLEAYVKRTDNKLDDQALKIVKDKLLSQIMAFKYSEEEYEKDKK